MIHLIGLAVGFVLLVGLAIIAGLLNSPAEGGLSFNKKQQSFLKMLKVPNCAAEAKNFRETVPTAVLESDRALQTESKDKFPEESLLINDYRIKQESVKFTVIKEINHSRI